MSEVEVVLCERHFVGNRDRPHPQVSILPSDNEHILRSYIELIRPLNPDYRRYSNQGNDTDISGIGEDAIKRKAWGCK